MPWFAATASFAVLSIAALSACSHQDAAAPPPDVPPELRGDAEITPEPPCELGDAIASDAASDGVSDAPAHGHAACNETVETCDPYFPPGLPVGACVSEGSDCVVNVRATCACKDELGPLFPYTCSCAAGAWRCTLQPPDARTCTNACLDAGTHD